MEILPFSSWPTFHSQSPGEMVVLMCLGPLGVYFEVFMEGSDDPGSHSPHLELLEFAPGARL